jgi:hypothetical protein
LCLVFCGARGSLAELIPVLDVHCGDIEQSPGKAWAQLMAVAIRVGLNDAICLQLSSPTEQLVQPFAANRGIEALSGAVVIDGTQVIYSCLDSVIDSQFEQFIVHGQLHAGLDFIVFQVGRVLAELPLREFKID